MAPIHIDGPTVLALSRQEAPVLRSEAWAENLSARGGYVLVEATGAHAVTLLATGTEVALALQARSDLERQGIGTRVVSMPCWSLFDAQSVSYRQEVLGESPHRVAVEAAARLGWVRYIGEYGEFVGLENFDASAPAEVLYEKFGVTVERVVGVAKGLMSGR